MEKLDGIGHESDTTVLLDLVDDSVAAFALNDESSPVLSERDAAAVGRYVRLRTNPRLLARVLKGSLVRAYQQRGNRLHNAVSFFHTRRKMAV